MWEKFKLWLEDNMTALFVLLVFFLLLTMITTVIWVGISDFNKPISTQCEIRQELEDLRTKMD